MTPSPMNAMAAMLTRTAITPANSFATRGARPTSLTEQMRHLLRSHGSMTAAHIMLDLDLPDNFFGNSGIVGALLKNDIAKGQVTRSDGQYHWNWHHDEALQTELQEACRLLRLHGYTVHEPA